MKQHGQYDYFPSNSGDETQPNSPAYLSETRYNPKPPRWMKQKKRSYSCGCGCTPLLGFLLGIAFVLAVYLFAPVRTNILLLGIDYTPPENFVGRSDTIILSTIVPLKPYIGILSIPRDLWLTIPGIGENRINTAHFFAEATQAGSGPYAAMQTIQHNFGVDVAYYMRVRFEGFRDVINAMGGVDLVLPEPMAGYPAGHLHLNGNKALAFARHRQGSDDFFRMEHGQLLMKSVLRQMISPRNWVHIPEMILTMTRSIDTNIPLWQWPRIGLALLRAGSGGIDNRTINRNMVAPITTQAGANVLLPDWLLINPVLFEMFGQ